jgi:hypothetical protein
LFFCRIEPVLKRLVHLMDPFFLRHEKPETVPPLPQKGTCLSSPDCKSRAFRRRTLVNQDI